MAGPPWDRQEYQKGGVPWRDCHGIARSIRQAVSHGGTVMRELGVSARRCPMAGPSRDT